MIQERKCWHFRDLPNNHYYGALATIIALSLGPSATEWSSSYIPMHFSLAYDMCVPRIKIGFEGGPLPRRFSADTATEIGPERSHWEDDMSKKCVQSPSTQESEGSTVWLAHLVLVDTSKYSITSVRLKHLVYAKGSILMCCRNNVPQTVWRLIY